MNLSGTDVVVKKASDAAVFRVANFDIVQHRAERERMHISLSDLMLGVCSCTCLTLDGQHGSQLSVQQFEAPLQIVLFLPAAS